jgi:hypothetical protein
VEFGASTEDRLEVGGRYKQRHAQSSQIGAFELDYLSLVGEVVCLSSPVANDEAEMTRAASDA